MNRQGAHVTDRSLKLVMESVKFLAIATLLVVSIGLAAFLILGVLCYLADLLPQLALPL